MSQIQNTELAHRRTAAAGAILEPLARAQRFWARWLKRQSALRDYRLMERLDDHHLRDVGVTREEIRAAKSQLLAANW